MWTNTKQNFKDIGKDAKDVVGATCRLAKDTVRLPLSFSKDVSASIKQVREAKAFYEAHKNDAVDPEN